MQIVFIEPSRLDAEPFTTSDIIALSTKLQHHTITRLIQKHESDFKEFGILRFKIEEIKGRGQPEKHYRLNEEQATLLITYLKNTEIVRAFKKELVRQFFAMRDDLRRRQINRELGKPYHKELTDAIKEHGGHDWQYKNYMDLCLKQVTGKNAKQLRTDRGAPRAATANDYLSADEMDALNALKVKVAVLVDLGMDYHQVKSVLSNAKLTRMTA